ncbi:hypothetical protein AB1Y20_019274 [Prymnesium parvum]
MGRELNTFAPTVRSATHKAQVARACALGRRIRCFDVTAAYLKGKFFTTEVIYARAPPGFRRYDARGVQYVWKLRVPLYGEADAGYIWNRTLVEQLVCVQGFVQSQHDPCLFVKQLADGTTIDICVHVDDGFVTDSGSSLADDELELLNVAFKDKHGADGVVLKEPRHFLGQNIDVHSPTRVTISSRAYVTQLAVKYLPAPLTEYSKCVTPCLKGLVEAYEEAVTRTAPLDPAGMKAYASKTGAAIFAGAASRCDALYALGME